jgi:thiamine biosynthesis lipoprotein
MNKYLLVFTIFIFAVSCKNNENLSYLKIAGFAQGTTYHITYGSADSVDFSVEIDSILKDFDMSLSTYEPGSLISRINRNETDLVDDKLKRTFEVAKEVHAVSNGAFDITVLPLVNAWGFGPGKRMMIDSARVDSLLQFVGMDKIKIVDNRIIKEDFGITMDVNAIAQGYSVDVVAGFFDDMKIKNYMVEIGGEVRAKGLNPKTETWKIGVDRPELGNVIPGNKLQVIIALKNLSLATSGNYRKYYEEDGIKYTHSIDPHSGYPARHSLLSASIVTKECITADAYATACMILGLEKSIEMIESLNDTEAYLIYGDEDGQYQVYFTDGMESMIED